MDLEDDLEEESSDEDAEKLFSPKKTRTGHAYFADGTKYRPSLRAGRDKPKYGRPYLKRNKPKSNSKKNRSAMRTKNRKTRYQWPYISYYTNVERHNVSSNSETT